MEESHNALQFAASYTRAVLDDSRSARPQIGTGILVGVEDRLFVASAAHCLGPNPFLIMTHDEFPIPCNPTPLLNRGRAGNRDIGFLELENDPAVPRLSVESLCPDPPPILPDPQRPEHLEFPSNSGQRLAVGLVMRPLVLVRGNIPQ